MDLNKRKAELEAKLAKINEAIEARKPKPVFEYGGILYYYPKIYPLIGAAVIDSDFTPPPGSQTYPNLDTGKYLFTSAVRCKLFDEKLNALAERQARIEYGEVEKPRHELLGFLHIPLTGEIRLTGTHISGMQIQEVYKFCQDVLDFNEQKGLRGER